jgi:hypothetical protein
MHFAQYGGIRSDLFSLNIILPFCLFVCLFVYLFTYLLVCLFVFLAASFSNDENAYVLVN